MRIKFTFRVLHNDEALKLLLEHHPEDYDQLLDIVFNVPDMPPEAPTV